MTLFIFLGYLLIAFNTIRYASKVWRQGNRLAGLSIAVLSLGLAILPTRVLFK
ncbi:hypothetical protein NBE98_21650 [Clostridium swellfunianum]|uniref:hypothetical protein n=1 Tax=Clostridium swellfunianum TaxID=1367462 RepID=UPI002030F4F3|nr:hypothetical protein [Clostridium swellfunianum]MCM0650967.1 hypothetical protein [Clostridium swellfunianum]